LAGLRAGHDHADDRDQRPCDAGPVGRQPDPAPARPAPPPRPSAVHPAHAHRPGRPDGLAAAGDGAERRVPRSPVGLLAGLARPGAAAVERVGLHDRPAGDPGRHAAHRARLDPDDVPGGALGHDRRCALLRRRWATTTRARKAPLTTCWNAEVRVPTWLIRLWITPSSSTPAIVPVMPPAPPVSRVPPMTTAAMASSSRPMPRMVTPDDSRAALSAPASPASRADMT